MQKARRRTGWMVRCAAGLLSRDGCLLVFHAGGVLMDLADLFNAILQTGAQIVQLLGGHVALQKEQLDRVREQDHLVRRIQELGEFFALWNLLMSLRIKSMTSSAPSKSPCDIG